MTRFAPSEPELRVVADELGLKLDDDGLRFFQAAVGITAEAYAALDAQPDCLPVSPYARGPVRRPSSQEDPHNAWYMKTEIKGADHGPLKGRTVAVKDNICVAGVPMMNGASTLEGYVPEIDATAVARLLDAGATIIGKTHCEHFCLSAGSHTNPHGPPHNPHRRGYTTGGSSSGSAAAVAAGEADMALPQDIDAVREGQCP